MGAPTILETRPDTANHWVSFSLEGSPSNRLALNARIYVRTGSVQQMGEVLSGGSYLSQNDLRLHFGLGSAIRVTEVKVLWPDGKVQHFEDLAGDTFYALKEGGAPAARKFH